MWVVGGGEGKLDLCGEGGCVMMLSQISLTNRFSQRQQGMLSAHSYHPRGAHLQNKRISVLGLFGTLLERQPGSTREKAWRWKTDRLGLKSHCHLL